MKKIVVIILLFTYAFASSDASVELHYCMGKLAGWGFEHTPKDGCGNCGMQKPDNSCCHDKQIQAKVDKEQQAVYNNISFVNNHFATIPFYMTIEVILVNAKTLVHPSIHAPPLVNDISAHLLNCNFRI